MRAEGISMMPTEERQHTGLQATQTSAALMQADAVVTQDEEMEIDLLELLLRLVEKWKQIAVAALLGAVIAAIMVLFVITPTYEATAKLYVLNASNSIVNLADLQIGNYLTSDYREVFSNRHVYEEVVRRLGLDTEYDELTERISISNPSDTRILYITAKSTDPVEAMNLANTYAAVAQEFIPQRMESQKPTLFETAVLPDEPASPNKLLGIILGFALGMFAMCAYVAIQFVLDDRIRANEDIEKHLGLAVLGIMPLVNRTQATKSAQKRKATPKKERKS